MPKIVDHAARREEIAHALWRVIVRDGIEGASVRAVAAEAGWSAGAMRHYFATQEELLRFGVELQLARIPGRLERIALTCTGRERAERLIAELLPLDAERIAEGRIWLAALARARIDPVLREVTETGWDGEQFLARGVVNDLAGRPWPVSGDPLEDSALEDEALRLHVFFDGLTLVGANFEHHVGPGEMRAALAGYLDALQVRLTPPESAGPAT